jgi:hypothetical protein
MRPFYLSARLSKEEYERYQRVLMAVLPSDIVKGNLSMSEKFRRLLDVLPKYEGSLTGYDYRAVFFASSIRESKEFDVLS